MQLIKLPETKSFAVWLFKIIIFAICLTITCSLWSILSGGLSILFPRYIEILILVCLLLCIANIVIHYIRHRKFLNNKFFVFCCLMLIFWGFGNFGFTHICCFLARSDIQLNSENIRFPIIRIETMVVDENNDIYCIDWDNRRLQVFDSNGNFLRGWFVNVFGGSFAIIIDEKELYIITSTGNNPVYSKSGQFIRYEQGVKYKDKYGLEKVINYHDKVRNIYTVHNGLWTKIIKKDSKGTQEILIKDPFDVWLINSPVICWLMMMSGGGLLAIKYCCNRKNK